MDDAAARALARLQHSDGEALAELARIVVAETTRTPLKDIATPRWIAGQIATGIEAATHSDMLRDWADRRIESEQERWSEEDRPLGTWLPDEADKPLRQVLGRAYAPDEELMFRIIDQPAVRNLVRELLTASLRRFGRKMRAPEGARLQDLGSKVRGRGKRLLGGLGMGEVAEQLGAGLGEVRRNVGDMADNIAGAVKDEVESAFDGRVTNFAQQATSDTIRAIARYAADPEHAEGFGELRVAVLDVILDTEVKVLAGEAKKLKPEELLDVVQAALRSAVAADDFVPRTEARIEALLDEAGDGTLGAWLQEVGLEQVWTETTTELLSDRLRAVVNTDAFVSWWGDLFEE